MPVPLSYPGVYIEEVPSGVRTITGVATSIAAFLGRAPRGPVNEPVAINSFADFQRAFGGLSPTEPLGYAIRDFYRNGGSRALVVRLYQSPDATDGTAKLLVDNLKLEAASPGAWGDSLAVTVDTDGITADVAARFGLAAGDLFNLTIEDTATNGPREVIRNLSVKESARRVDRALALESNLVRLQRKPDGTPDLPSPADIPAAGSSDTGGGGLESASPLPSAAIIGDDAGRTGMNALQKADLFNLMCIPPDVRGGDTPNAVYQAALTFCRDHRAMLIVDPPAAWSANPQTAVASAKAGLAGLGLNGDAARNAALYFPRLIESDPLREDQPDVFVPCGVIAGVMARTDATRGVWKAPAGIDAGMNGVDGLDVNLNDLENGDLNQIGINVLRAFPIVGRVVWGARTMRGADQLADEYKYVPVRRMALYIEESLFRGTKWVVFEPNDEPLWAQIRLNIGAFMHDLFRQGAFQGQTPRDAYLVKCDRETTTQYDIDRGIVNILVGFAPLKPAEFVVIHIQQLAGQTAA